MGLVKIILFKQHLGIHKNNNLILEKNKDFVPHQEYI